MWAQVAIVAAFVFKALVHRQCCLSPWDSWERKDSSARVLSKPSFSGLRPLLTTLAEVIPSHPEMGSKTKSTLWPHMSPPEVGHLSDHGWHLLSPFHCSISASQSSIWISKQRHLKRSFVFRFIRRRKLNLRDIEHLTYNCTAGEGPGQHLNPVFCLRP